MPLSYSIGVIYTGELTAAMVCFDVQFDQKSLSYCYMFT